MKLSNLFLAASLSLVTIAGARAQVPISGMPVEELAHIEAPIQDYMAANGVPAAVVGIARHGQILYLRGYGWKDQAQTDPLQETATFRVASITKTFTAAVIVDLAERGLLNLNDFAFDLGQPQGGILNLDPFPELGDPRLTEVRVVHLLYHIAGWDRDITGGWTRAGLELIIQNAMELPELPTKEEHMRWILGKQLQHDPGGTVEHYSNEGYMALGLIAEQVAGTTLLNYVWTHLLTKELWFPPTDFFMGHSLAEDQNPREPHYYETLTDTNVFDPDGPPVYLPYGSWNHENKDGYGRVVSSAIPLLHHAHHFILNDDLRGQRIEPGLHPTTHHGGAQPGNRSELWQTGDTGLDYVVMTNRYDSTVDNAAQDILGIIQDTLNADPVPSWPRETVDCRWLDFSYSGPQEGTFDRPYDTPTDLLWVPSWSKVKIKPGATPWTGVFPSGTFLITTTEGGSVVIGQ